MNPCSRRYSWVVLGFIAALAAPQARAQAPKTVAVAVGDCGDKELLAAMGAFQKALKEQLGPGLVDAQRAMELLRPRPEGTLADGGRIFETAQTQFYAGQHGNALDTVRSALTLLQKLPPSASVWPVIARSQVLEGLVLKAMNRRAESVDAFKKVLALDRQYMLDPDYYTPTTIAQFEQLKAQVARDARGTLKVRATAGPPAQVFINGAPLGNTPLDVKLEAGRYSVQLQQGEMLSFVHPVRLDREALVQVNVGLEGSISATAPLCLADAKGQPETARPLGTFFEAGHVVVLTSSAAGKSGTNFAATLWAVGEEGRTRRAEWKAQAGRRDSGLAQLAKDVWVAPVLAVPALKTPAPADAPVRAQLSPEPSPPAPSVVLTEAAPARGRRVLPAAALWVAGAAALVTGAVLYAVDGPDRARLATLTPAGRIPPEGDPDHDQAATLIRRLDGRGIAAAALISGGVALSGAGTGVFFLWPAEP